MFVDRTIFVNFSQIRESEISLAELRILTTSLSGIEDFDAFSPAITMQIISSETNLTCWRIFQRYISAIFTQVASLGTGLTCWRI